MPPFSTADGATFYSIHLDFIYEKTNVTGTVGVQMKTYFLSCNTYWYNRVQLGTYLVSRNANFYSLRTNAAIGTKFLYNEKLSGIYKIRTKIDTVSNTGFQ